jgi:ABC-type antimicrobial peptide transport system permease subunit
VGAGLLGAFLLTRLMSALLFGVHSRDPLTFSVVTIVLTTVAIAACAIPARRASRLDPMDCLRS